MLCESWPVSSIIVSGPGLAWHKVWHQWRVSRRLPSHVTLWRMPHHHPEIIPCHQVIITITSWICSWLNSFLRIIPNHLDDKTERGMILKDVTTRIWSTLFPRLSAYAGWWQEPYCAPQISSLTFDLLATGRLPQCRGILAFINLFIIQFKWNATTEAGTITSRGEDNQRNENKMDFLSSFIQLFTFYFNSWSMMQCYGCSRFQFFILVMSSGTMCAASVLHNSDTMSTS